MNVMPAFVHCLKTQGHRLQSHNHMTKAFYKIMNFAKISLYPPTQFGNLHSFI